MADLVHEYSLHGVWDRLNPIGDNIYGHTNLTEINLAFDLFWRNNVPANKLNSQYFLRCVCLFSIDPITQFVFHLSDI